MSAENNPGNGEESGSAGGASTRNDTARAPVAEHHGETRGPAQERVLDDTSAPGRGCAPTDESRQPAMAGGRGGRGVNFGDDAALSDEAARTPGVDEAARPSALDRAMEAPARAEPHLSAQGGAPA